VGFAIALPTLQIIDLFQLTMFNLFGSGKIEIRPVKHYSFSEKDFGVKT
jgi:hypothetical protein